MGIFKRLFDIARAELNVRTGGVSSKRWQQKGSHQEEFYQDPIFQEESFSGDTHDEYAEDSRPMAKHYAALELPYGADLAAVRKAWKDMLRKYHPDLHSSDPEKQRIAHEVSQALNQSYEALKDHLKYQ